MQKRWNGACLMCMEFNPSPAVIMHVDLNSCFATVEQQANPLFRGKPLVVAAYTTGNGCILAASKEAKLLGIKTGMQVREGKWRYKNLIVLPSDPDKYRLVNHQLTRLLGSYTDTLSVESIDEMVLSLDGTPALFRHTMEEIALEIKQRIRREIGDWLTVSIGIAPNRYLAKVASGLQKPDGLVWITKETIENIFSSLALEDLTGIKEGNATRLRSFGIMNPVDMLHASEDALVRAFHSIVGFHWWRKLHGWEISSQAASAEGYGEPKQKSFGQSYALPKAYTPTDPRLWQILSQLVMKMGRRLRQAHCTANGISVSALFTDHTHWHTQKKLNAALFADWDFYETMRIILLRAPMHPVRLLAISCYDLKQGSDQLCLLPQDTQKKDLIAAIDHIQERFGEFVIHSGRMVHMEQKVLDRIAFGKVK